MCTLFANLYVLLTWCPHMVYQGDPIYITYLYDQMWLVGYINTTYVISYVLCNFMYVLFRVSCLTMKY